MCVYVCVFPSDVAVEDDGGDSDESADECGDSDETVDECGDQTLDEYGELTTNTHVSVIVVLCVSFRVQVQLLQRHN